MNSDTILICLISCLVLFCLLSVRSLLSIYHSLSIYLFVCLSVISYSPYTSLLLFSFGNHDVGSCKINRGAVDLWAWDNSCAWIPPTHLSAALQIGSDVGVRSLCMEVN